MPATRLQRYTCQISIGSTRKPPGKNSADPPDIVLDSEWRQIKGDTYTSGTDDRQTRLQNLKQEKSVSPELEQFERGTCIRTYKERTDGLRYPHSVQQDTHSVQQEPHNVQQEPHSVQQGPRSVQQKPQSVQQDTYSVQQEPHSVQQEPHNVQQEPQSVQQKPHSVQQDTYSVQQEPHSVQQEPHNVQQEPHSVQQENNSRSANPELGQLNRGIHAGETGDRRTSPVSVQQTDNSKSVNPELGPLEGGTYRNANRTEEGWTHPQSLQQEVNSKSVSPEFRQLEGVINTGVTDDEQTRPLSVQHTDKSKSVDHELEQLKRGTSAGRKDHKRTNPQVVQREENSKPLTPELGDGANDGRTSLQSLQWKGSSTSISPKLRQSYLDFFHKADIYNLGQLTVHQFRDAVVKLGFNGTTFQIAAMFADLNPNDDLIVTLDAFMTEMCKSDSRRWTQHDLKDIFHSLDVDGDGLITENDIVTSLERQDKVKLDDTIQRMILEYDFDRDGALSLQDFLKGCQRDQRK